MPLVILPTYSQSTSLLHSYWRLYIDAFSGSGSGILFGDLAFNGTVGGPDQTTGGTAIASSYYSTFTPDRAFNNNTTNDGWISNGSTVGQWIGYHFLLPVTVAEIIWYSTVLFGTASPTAFTLQYSDDGALWTSVKSWSGLTPPSGFTNVTLTLAV